MIFLLQLIKCLSLCTTQPPSIRFLLSTFCGIFVAHWTKNFYSTVILLYNFMCSLMQIGLEIKMIILPLVPTLFILVGTLFLGVQRSNKPLLDLPPRSSIALLRLLLLSFNGFAPCLQNLVLSYRLPPLSILTMLVPFN
ncbi:hypothetical protein Pint_11270 [Pistacia integerrima]|uniref:Uncharacterized protein n=1 Tax=Pistacia integerrima TaxID=434235 RepID=A0ACC0XIQ2_9ROSI|nr:hypothetical protein Pint_11270 [Pistacia integerrima]